MIFKKHSCPILIENRVNCIINSCNLIVSIINEKNEGSLNWSKSALYSTKNEFAASIKSLIIGNFKLISLKFSFFHLFNKLFP